MTSLENRANSSLVKALVLGDSGGGKTSALASLACAGYHLYILDFDNGTDILLDPAVLDPQYRKNIDVEVCTDKMKGTSKGPQVVGTPQAMKKAMNLLNKWNDEVGGVEQWGPDKVLVIDSLTFMGDAALNYILANNMRVGEKIRIQDWGDAMQIQENVLKHLYSDNVGCHIIINCHVKFLSLEDDDLLSGGLKGYPMALGTKLPPKVPRYFNSVFFVQAQGSGQNVRRKIKTQSTPQIELKNPRPSIILSEYDVSDGMAKIFEVIRGETAQSNQPN